MSAELFKTIIRSGAFGGFVILGLLTQWSTDRFHLRAARLLIGYTLFISIVVGLTQIEAWPFSNWALVHTIRAPVIDRWDLVGVDAAGNAYTIDPRVLEPFAFEEFHTWLRIHFFRLDEYDRRQIAADILRRAEAARRRFRLTGRVGTIDRFLGPLTAPRHFHRGTVWRTAADVPAVPFIQLRIVRTSWDINARAQNPSAVEHEVLFETQ